VNQPIGFLIKETGFLRVNQSIPSEVEKSGFYADKTRVTSTWWMVCGMISVQTNLLKEESK